MKDMLAAGPSKTGTDLTNLAVCFFWGPSRELGRRAVSDFGSSWGDGAGGEASKSVPWLCELEYS